MLPGSQLHRAAQADLTMVVTMNFIEWMQPRDPRAAARSVATLCGVAAITTVLTAPLQDQQLTFGATVAVGALVVLVAVLGLLVYRMGGGGHRVAWALAPLVGVPALVAIDLLTHDASVTAQVFFLFPALYGASQLRPPGVVVTSALSVLGEMIVVGVQLPPRDAVVQGFYVTAAICTTAALLAVATERHARLVTRLEQLAAIDPLTGLATRRVLDEAASSALSGAGSDAGTALLLIDIDHFKSINDRHGHPTGDAVLVQLAELLVAHSRPTEVVCRMGGDEIALLLPACSAPTALTRAEDLLAAVQSQQFRTPTDGDVEVSVSMGCAHLPTNATDLRALYTAADGALYEAKQAGRGRVTPARLLAAR